MMKLDFYGHILIHLMQAVLTYSLEDLKFNTMLQGQTINIVQGVSLDECWKNCEQRLACGSINYERKLHLCYLNSREQPYDLTMRIDMVFREKVGQTDKVVCGKEECTERKVCDVKSEQCKVQECEPLQEIPGVQILGNMLSVGSKRRLLCRDGFIPVENNIISKEAVCEVDGWKNIQLKCEPLTCKGLADKGILQSKLYNAYDGGSKMVIQVFCEFPNEGNIGYSFLSRATMNPSVNITTHYNIADHVQLRYKRNGKQFASKMQCLQKDREDFGVSVFNSQSPNFSGPREVTKPYFFIGFIPTTIGDHFKRLKGYTCNEKNYTFYNSDDNPDNYFAIFQSENTTRKTYKETPVRDGWKDCSSAVETLRYIPEEAFFNSYEIGMGGGGCFIRNDDAAIEGMAFGLPFEY